MASNINPYNIDGTFPVAGQDNSSQGFRNNFTNIKNNLTFAQNEITDLQNKVLLTSALTGQTLNNDMAGTVLRRPQLQSWTNSLYSLGTASNTVTLDFNVANFQQITTGGSITLNFVNWPTTLGYGLMRILIAVTSVAHTVTLPTTITLGVADIAGYNAGTHAITFDAPGNYVFDVSYVYDNIAQTNTYLISDITRNKASLKDPNLYFNPAVSSSTLFVGFNAGLSTAIASDAGLDSISALGSYNSVGIGSLSQANVFYTQMDTGGIAGYSVSSARGNIQTANVQPVQSKDFLGYVNSIAYTGNGSGNVFQQSASINFFATGSNVAYGLGGNIGFFTADDGGTQLNKVVQAVGIENDQSAKFYGNVEVTSIFKTDSTIVEGGTYANTMVTTGGYYNQFVANSAISTLIIDSSTSASIPLANIILPSSPYDRQRFKIVAVAPIATANIYAPNFAAVKYVASNKFSSGNTTVSLTYLAGQSTWYLS